MERQLTQGLWPFIKAGNAIFTLVSKKTGTRYTYRVRQAGYGREDKEKDRWFVTLLSGPDNQSDYVYLGKIEGGRFELTFKSKMTMDSLPVAGIAWLIPRVIAGAPVDSIEFWHAGRCARCGRMLTVPQSIETGFGPECAQRMAA